MHFRAESMGISAQLRNVVDTITRSLSGTEFRSSDIHGVGAVVDSRNAAFNILGRSQKFDSLHG